MKASTGKMTCPACGGPLKGLHSRCSTCYEEVQRKAKEWQARDYLASYLYSRVDARGVPFPDSAVAEPRECWRLVQKARVLGVDWTVLPKMMTFDQRLAALTNRPKPKKKIRCGLEKKSAGEIAPPLCSGRIISSANEMR